MIFHRGDRVYDKRTFSDGTVGLTSLARCEVIFDEGQELTGTHWVPNIRLAMTADEISKREEQKVSVNQRMKVIAEIMWYQAESARNAERARILRDRL